MPEIHPQEIEIACALSMLPPYLQRAAHEELCAFESLSQLAVHPQLEAPLRHRIPAAQSAIDAAQKLGLTIIPLRAPQYPTPLTYLHIPPAILFIRSKTPLIDLPSLTSKTIALVGSRAATLPTCAHVSTVASELCEKGLIIVSGLALGVDGSAHRGALRSSLPTPTIAVLAHGLDSIYPSSHKQLAHEIVDKGGLLLSEYRPGIAPLPHHFLARNRIIAALSAATIVSQASSRSGSLVTAQATLDLGREVLILRPPDPEPLSEGSKKLLSEGALEVACAHEVVQVLDGEDLCSQTNESRTKYPTGTIPPQAPVTLPLSELLRISKYSLAHITQLELKGAVQRLPGNRISISRSLLSELSECKS